MEAAVCIFRRHRHVKDAEDYVVQSHTPGALPWRPDAFRRFACS